MGTVRRRRLLACTHHIIPFIHPLYTFITIFRPMYTRYTCMYTILYTIYTPLNMYTLCTP